MKKALKYLKLDKGIILKIYKRLRDTDNVRWDPGQRQKFTPMDKIGN